MKTKSKIQSRVYVSIIPILLRYVHINGSEYASDYFWVLRLRDISTFSSRGSVFTTKNILYYLVRKLINNTQTNELVELNKKGKKTHSIFCN